ncbi:uncharacterized protein LOC109721333 [Ananas comosus]|uniref:Uncharacterized protein LOC109721333 n=2 Tax=Ananas comosus TaxID=4615 RepID=A0A6P5GEV0_ANACO|nr:uncharacterized protein LOC109721333 [Ananas comosus]XP_020104479.1 uncharacterized protein LOC109721333 [Ananas comosus]CAD1844236.1 unnamed protein product [Ananas comosus var. bracteatus]
MSYDTSSRNQGESLLFWTRLVCYQDQLMKHLPRSYIKHLKIIHALASLNFQSGFTIHHYAGDGYVILDLICHVFWTRIISLLSTSISFSLQCLNLPSIWV